MFLVVFFVLNIASIYEASVKKISCEKVKEIQSGELKKCLLTEHTVINAPGYILISPKDESVESISFAYNKNIKYLPQSVFEIFPALKVFDAAACAIKNISNGNFAHLGNLSDIYLDGNLIDRIESGTFEGLTLLKTIFISKMIAFI